MSHIFYKPRGKAKKANFIDTFIYPIALIAPIMTIPQILTIYAQQKTQGVSTTTWGAYAIVSVLWIFYGMDHKEKPIILANILSFIFDSAIVLGVLLHN